MKKWIVKFGTVASKVNWVAELLTRGCVGFVFFQSGYGKLTHLDKTIEFFASIGIPFANVQAPFAAITEVGCGALLLAGLATRFAAVPLVAIMVVAIRTAKWEEITDLSSLFGTSEFLYIILLVWLIAQGAGRLSVDAWLRSKLCGGRCS